MTFRPLSFNAHSVLEGLAAPLLIVAPFVLGLGGAAGAVTLALGAVLMWLALTAAAGSGSVPLSTHIAFDYALGILAIGTGVAVGIAAEEPVATAFMVGFGAAHLALSASTRYSTRGV
jgi:hypothetical protein